ncbi:MAG: hypothetical protein ACYSSI_01965 [Planctomycetota bacterium]|jgi:hypothetical protein
MLGSSELADVFCENIKGLLANCLESQHQRLVLQDFKEQLMGGKRVWVRENYPDAVFEQGEMNGKFYITILLEGKTNGS